MCINKTSMDERGVIISEKQLEKVLSVYYATLFPYNLMYRWLSYGDPLYFLKREICVVLSNDRYVRYKSFNSEDEFRDYISMKVPLKINIGAVYDRLPMDGITFTNLQPIEKELVFDIDMTDYDAIRTCCQEAKVCKKCWKFLSIACKILHSILTDDFGFKHILWVFSGRRGIHCWVCDRDARNLSDKERMKIIGYINVIEGGICVQKKVNLLNELVYPIQRAVDIIDKNFIDFLIVEQNILGTEAGLKDFIALLPKDPSYDEFEKIISEKETSLERWETFVSCYNNLIGVSKFLKEELMLHYVYPRLDIGVTRKREHLLKAPFCVHPKTNKICVPFRASEIEQFDIDKVPTINSILQELHSCGNEIDLFKTSLKPYVNIYLEFVLELERFL